MILALPNQVREVLTKLNLRGYSAYIHGECVRMMITGQTPLDFDVMSDAEPKRIQAVFEHKPVPGFVRVTSYCDADEKAALARGKTFTFDAIGYGLKAGTNDRNSERERERDWLMLDPWNGEDALRNSLPVLLPDRTPESARHADIAVILLWKSISDVLAQCDALFTALLPELGMLDGELLEVTRKSVGYSSPILELRYALLFCQLGKPDCHSRTPDGRDLYHGHAERSRIYASRIMKRLGCPDELRLRVEDIIKAYEKVQYADEADITRLSESYSADELKTLWLFNSALSRANSDEKSAMMYKKRAKGL